MASSMRPVSSSSVLPRGDEEAVARHRGGRAQAHQLGVVAQVKARGHFGPGVVPDELPFAVPLHVQRRRAGQLGPAPHRQVRGQPAGIGADAAGALQAGEPLPLQRRGGERPGQRVPGLPGDLGQRALPFHAVGLLRGHGSNIRNAAARGSRASLPAGRLSGRRNRKEVNMGKGDRRSRRGKLCRGSHGKRLPHRSEEGRGTAQGRSRGGGPAQDPRLLKAPAARPVGAST